MASDKKKQCQLQALLACRLRGLKSWSPPSSKQQLAVLKVGLSDSDSYTVLVVGQFSSLDSLSGSDSHKEQEKEEEGEEEQKQKEEEEEEEEDEETSTNLFILVS